MTGTRTTRAYTPMAGRKLAVWLLFCAAMVLLERGADNRYDAHAFKSH